MTHQDFLDQIAKVKREIASWPRWMREASRVASATLPTINETPMIPIESTECYACQGEGQICDDCGCPPAFCCCHETEDPFEYATHDCSECGGAGYTEDSDDE